MELLTIILLIIIGLLTFLLLKKERVLGINTDENKNNDQIISDSFLNTIQKKKSIRKFTQLKVDT